MTVRTRPHRSKTRPRLGRRAKRPDAPAGAAQQAAAQPSPAPDGRERTVGGPQDRAAYSCACGYVFEAPVSTTVGCPHCGCTQAW